MSIDLRVQIQIDYIKNELYNNNPLSALGYFCLLKHYILEHELPVPDGLYALRKEIIGYFGAELRGSDD